MDVVIDVLSHIQELDEEQVAHQSVSSPSGTTYATITSVSRSSASSAATHTSAQRASRTNALPHALVETTHGNALDKLLREDTSISKEFSVFNDTKHGDYWARKVKKIFGMLGIQANAVSDGSGIVTVTKLPGYVVPAEAIFKDKPEIQWGLGDASSNDYLKSTSQFKFGMEYPRNLDVAKASPELQHTILSDVIHNCSLDGIKETLLGIHSMEGTDNPFLLPMNTASDSPLF